MPVPQLPFLAYLFEVQGFGPWSRAVWDPGVQLWRLGETPSSEMKGTVAST